jgi:hypothetical protein
MIYLHGTTISLEGNGMEYSFVVLPLCFYSSLSLYLVILGSVND